MGKIVEKYRRLPIHVKASLWFVVCTFFQKGITILTTPIFIRLLSTEEFGLYQTFTSWMNVLTVLATLNLYLGMYMRGLVKYSDRRRQFSSSMQCLCLLLVSIWTLLYFLVEGIFEKLIPFTRTQMIIMFVLIWTTSAFSFWAAEQRVELKYRALVFITISVSLLKPGLSILLIRKATDRFTARILGLVLVEIVMYTWCFFYQVARGRVICDRYFWKQALTINIPLIPHYLSMSLLNDADKIMIERMIGASEAAIYGVAYALGQLMRLLVVALSHTVEPWLYEQIKKRNVQAMANIAYPLWCGIAIMNILIILIAPDIVHLYATESYYDAIWVIPPVAISVFFIFLYMFFAVFEFYFVKTKSVAFATCVGAVLNVVLNYYFFIKFGYYAAGYTTLVCYILYAFMHWFFMRRICKKEFPGVSVYSGRVIISLSIISVAIGLALIPTYYYPYVRYSLLILLLVVAYIFRKRIISYSKMIISMKKTSGGNNESEKNT